jgi:hypothetical protein
MGSVEAAVRAELTEACVRVDSSTLATVALDLARRLVAGPTDRDATMLARELRHIRAALRIDVDTASELEGFLRDIANPTFRGPGD